MVGRRAADHRPGPRAGAGLATWASRGPGALDRPAAGLANRLVGNDPDAAVLEVTLGGLRRAGPDGAVAWRSPARRCRSPSTASPPGHGRAGLGAGRRRAAARYGRRRRAVLRRRRGRDRVEPVLGSRSTDTLAWVGPARVQRRRRAAAGPARRTRRSRTTRRGRPAGPLRISPGPRDDWFEADAVAGLCAAPYTVTAESNRIGLRLEGRSRRAERATASCRARGWCSGAVQVPPNGQPVVFLADHPPTGGYPVIGGGPGRRPVAVRAAAAGRRGPVHPGSGGSGGRQRTERGVVDGEAADRPGRGLGGLEADGDDAAPDPQTQPRPISVVHDVHARAPRSGAAAARHRRPRRAAPPPRARRRRTGPPGSSRPARRRRRRAAGRRRRCRGRRAASGPAGAIVAAAVGGGRQGGRPAEGGEVVQPDLDRDRAPRQPALRSRSATCAACRSSRPSSSRGRRGRCRRCPRR